MQAEAYLYAVSPALSHTRLSPREKNCLMIGPRARPAASRSSMKAVEFTACAQTHDRPCTRIFHQASHDMRVLMLFQMTDQVPAEFWLMWIVVACTLCNRSLSGMVIFGAVHSKPCFAGSSRPAVVVLWTGLKLHGPYSVQLYAQCIVGHAS